MALRTAFAQFHGQRFGRGEFAVHEVHRRPIREAVIPAQQLCLVAMRREPAEGVNLRGHAHRRPWMRTSGWRSTSWRPSVPGAWKPTMSTWHSGRGRLCFR